MFDPPKPPDVRPTALYAPAALMPEQLEVLDAQETLSGLMLTYGAKRVQRWLRNLAAIHGMEID